MAWESRRSARFERSFVASGAPTATTPAKGLMSGQNGGGNDRGTAEFSFGELPNSQAEVGRRDADFSFLTGNLSRHTISFRVPNSLVSTNHRARITIRRERPRNAP
jgi:hypothetical protein